MKFTGESLQFLGGLLQLLIALVDQVIIPSLEFFILSPNLSVILLVSHFGPGDICLHVLLGLSQLTPEQQYLLLSTLEVEATALLSPL